MTILAQHVSAKRTPQAEPIPGSDQVANNAGGFCYPVDQWTRLDRYLILGSEGGSYYVGEKKLTQENAKVVLECANQDAVRTVNRIREISVSGRAPKNDPAVFALALVAGLGKPDAKELALRAMLDVCRTGTHFLQFVANCDQLRGYGRQYRRALGSWYTTKRPADLAYQALKYQNREGFTQRDVLRLAHTKASGLTNDIIHWIVKGWPDVGEEVHPEPAMQRIWAFEWLKKHPDTMTARKLIRDHGLTREMVPTQLLNDPLVWEELIDKMPMTAMIRNLGKMTSVGLLKPLSAASKLVTSRLADSEYLRRSRVHPISVLWALKTYAAGHGFRSGSTWSPVSQIVDALDGAFYGTFANVEPTGLRWLLALDVSGSMSSAVNNTNLTAREVTAAISLVIAATEPNHCHVAFSAGGYTSQRAGRSQWASYSGMQANNGISTLDISPRQRLDDVVKKISNLPFGGTDCALPWLWAADTKTEVDVCVTLTDNETWHGAIHPSQALREYRQKMGIAAKSAILATTSSGFTIADPADAGSLDIAGFDASVPVLLNQFARGLDTSSQQTEDEETE